MMQLHYFPGNASLVPHLLLEELGVPFELKLVDRKVGAQHSDEYKRLNPNGKIPVLVDGELVLYETAAICLYLVDTHPQAGLAPPMGTAERAHFYKWLAWIATTLQAEMQLYFYPDRWADAGDAAAAAHIRTHAERHLEPMFDQLDGEFARHGGPWFRGERFSALDPYVMTMCRWSRGMTRPARTLPHLGPYLQRMLARPAVQRVFEREGLTAPPF